LRSYAAFAMLGSFLAAAGKHLTAQAVSFGSASAGCFGAGFFLLIRSVKRRGGLLDAEPTPAEPVTYNLEHLAQFHPAKRGVSPHSAQPDKREYREIYGREHSDHRGQQ
jgi:hypothetical protein